jgi:hypothetical protein
MLGADDDQTIISRDPPGHCLSLLLQLVGGAFEARTKMINIVREASKPARVISRDWADDFQHCAFVRGACPVCIDLFLRHHAVLMSK